MPDKETWNHLRTVREDVTPVLGTLPDSENDMPTAMPKLNANNLAEASAEPLNSTLARIDNTSVMSRAGTDAATSIEESKIGTQQRLKNSKRRIVHVAFVGDGLCGKTSLMA
jgi:hypothetical protein